MTTGIIIQARLTSQRFPGKAMAMLGGKTVLERVVERAKMVPFVDKVIVAVPWVRSYMFARECVRLGVLPFTSPFEHNVLARYFDAATFNDLSVIVRITADCPFLNPLLIGELIWQFRQSHADYANNCYPTRTYAKGLDAEVFTYDILKKAFRAAKDPYELEHVTPWMQEHAPKKLNLTQDEDCSHVNLCVDYPEDIARLEKLVEHEERELEKVKGLLDQYVSTH